MQNAMVYTHDDHNIIKVQIIKAYIRWNRVYSKQSKTVKTSIT